MSKKLNVLIVLVVLFSMLLSACATNEPVVTDAPVVTEAPTEVMTDAPVVAVDFTAQVAAMADGLTADNGFGNVAATNLNEELVEKAPFLLDVREITEAETDGYIEGSITIPVRDLLKNLDKLPGLDEPIVTYCKSGHRGAIAMAALKTIGYTNVRNLSGGLASWVKAELPVVTGTPATPAAISTPIVADEALFTAVDAMLTNLPEGFAVTSVDALNTAIAENNIPVIVDLRTAAEIEQAGWITDAIKIPFNDLFASLDQLPAKDESIVVLCKSGHRGSLALAGLRTLGYENVTNLGGGMNAWVAAELPVEGYVNWNAVYGEYLANLPAGFNSISAADLNAKMADVAPFILDVREAGELSDATDGGYLTGAVNIPVRDLLKNLDKLPALDQPIVVYCKSGHRGALALAALNVLGYTDVKNLAGGLSAWKKAELPLEAAGAPAAPVAGTAPEVDQYRLAKLDAFLTNLPEGFYAIAPADVNTLLAETEKPFLLDVRTAEEIAADGTIEGSVNIPIVELFTRLAELPQDKAAKIIVYCKSGHRGALALEALRMIGYTDVTNIAGGLGAWIAAELPVVK